MSESSGAKPQKASTRTSELVAEVDEIKDSRGRPTIRVTLSLGNARGVGDVPAGASTGEDEARTVAVKAAMKNIDKIIVPLIRESNADIRRHESLLELEAAIVARAGDNFGDLGANAAVPVSRALWQLAAALRSMSLCAYLRKYQPDLAGNNRVHLYMNIFNGGLHALKPDDGEVLGKDRIDIQEIMVVPVSATNYRDALAMGERIDATLKDVLTRRYGADRLSRADEAGFSVKGLGDSASAIAHVFESVERAGYTPGEDIKIALDVAATSFFDSKKDVYKFGGNKLSSDDMIAYLVDLVDRYPGKVLSVEDGLDENDWQGWGKLSAAMKERDVLTIGDDLFVTQIKRLRRGINNGSAHAILVKVNQNGSVLGTLEVIRYARENGLKCVISHRSGETLDDSIADLAQATGAFGLKTGDPQPEDDFPDPKSWVRRCKYLRMIDLEEGVRH